MDISSSLRNMLVRAKKAIKGQVNPTKSRKLLTFPAASKSAPTKTMPAPPPQARPAAPRRHRKLISNFIQKEDQAEETKEARKKRKQRPPRTSQPQAPLTLNDGDAPDEDAGIGLPMAAKRKPPKKKEPEPVSGASTAVIYATFPLINKYNAALYEAQLKMKEYCRLIRGMLDDLHADVRWKYDLTYSEVLSEMMSSLRAPGGCTEEGLVKAFLEEESEDNESIAKLMRRIYCARELVTQFENECISSTMTARDMANRFHPPEVFLSHENLTECEDELMEVISMKAFIVQDALATIQTLVKEGGDPDDPDFKGTGPKVFFEKRYKWTADPIHDLGLGPAAERVADSISMKSTLCCEWLDLLQGWSVRLPALVEACVKENKFVRYVHHIKSV